MFEDFEDEIQLDKAKVLDFLSAMEGNVRDYAFQAKPHIALKAYAQASCLQTIMTALMSGHYDVVDNNAMVN